MSGFCGSDTTRRAGARWKSHTFSRANDDLAPVEDVRTVGSAVHPVAGWQRHVGHLAHVAFASGAGVSAMIRSNR